LNLMRLEESLSRLRRRVPIAVRVCLACEPSVGSMPPELCPDARAT
jgi:hypothetical protein